MYACWNARAVGLSMTIEDAIELAADAGFEGVDLLVRDAVDSGADVAALRRRMDGMGLRGGGWTLPMNWKNESAAFEADLAKLPRYAEAAAELGLLQTGTWVRYESDPVDPEILNDPARRAIEAARAMAWQTDRLARIADVLARNGIHLGLEILGSRSERTGRGIVLTSSYEELLRTFSGLARTHPNVGVLADAYHLYASGEPASTALGWGAEAIGWVHVADPANTDRTTMRDVDRLLPGESDVGLSRPLLALLAECGYDGPVTAEPLMQSSSFASDQPRARAIATRESLRRIWP
jgi:sugar phosphate isomerase/epimerase